MKLHFNGLVIVTPLNQRDELTIEIGRDRGMPGLYPVRIMWPQSYGFAIGRHLATHGYTATPFLEGASPEYRATFTLPVATPAAADSKIRQMMVPGAIARLGPTTWVYRTLHDGPESTQHSLMFDDLDPETHRFLQIDRDLPDGFDEDESLTRRYIAALEQAAGVETTFVSTPYVSVTLVLSAAAGTNRAATYQTLASLYEHCLQAGS